MVKQTIEHLDGRRYLVSRLAALQCSPQFTHAAFDASHQRRVARGQHRFEGLKSVKICRQRQLLRRRAIARARSEEHTSELQSLMRISYAVVCLKKNNIRVSIL